MILCIDSGNSRIKWGVHDGKAWLAQGACAHGDVFQLARLPDAWPQIECVMLANVAGQAAGDALRASLASCSNQICEVRSSASAGGVTNGYDRPEQLGVDRWCALIGARALFGQACVVVMAGTATTIDTLDGAGSFRGGMILPGFDLMRRSLASDTAALRFAEGRHLNLPTCTEDAIATGCLEAQIGAVERAVLRHPEAVKLCVLSGGNAELIGNRLVIPHVLAHNLPLEGLRRLAEGKFPDNK
jgi:type III pantothenate kinase